jgi:hypothetical protein
VVNPSVRVGLAEITWSFSHVLAIQAKKHFWQTLAPGRALGKQARGAAVEWDEALGTPSALVMELAAVLQSAWPWRLVLA